ncbi:TetR family transcriptional regulator [Pseudonocardia sp. CNS-139]|nr:TetR family transcriptional regulator [Pseudonocardia sp. CNS-139]
MPKRVDVDARRREIADALLRLAATEGLESVSLRHVAAEAGVSMGAVQHYFRTKDDMLRFALEHQARRREQRIVARLTAAGRPPTVREIIRTSLLEVLPTDDESRADWLVGIAFFIRAMRDPAMAEVLAEGVPQVVGFFTEQLGAAQADGLLAPGVDPYQEAVLLWSAVDSQATAIVLGERDPGDAVATVDYYLDRLFVI